MAIKHSPGCGCCGCLIFSADFQKTEPDVDNTFWQLHFQALHPTGSTETTEAELTSQGELVEGQAIVCRNGIQSFSYLDALLLLDQEWLDVPGNRLIVKLHDASLFSSQILTVDDLPAAFDTIEIYGEKTEQWAYLNTSQLWNYAPWHEPPGYIVGTPQASGSKVYPVELVCRRNVDHDPTSTIDLIADRYVLAIDPGSDDFLWRMPGFALLTSDGHVAIETLTTQRKENTPYVFTNQVNTFSRGKRSWYPSYARFVSMPGNYRISISIEGEPLPLGVFNAYKIDVEDSASPRCERHDPCAAVPNGHVPEVVPTQIEIPNYETYDLTIESDLRSLVYSGCTTTFHSEILNPSHCVLLTSMSRILRAPIMSSTWIMIR